MLIAHKTKLSLQARSQDFAQGGGGMPNPSRSDQSHDHIPMPIHKLLFILTVLDSKQDKMKTVDFL